MKKEVTFHIVVTVDDHGELDEMTMKEGIVEAYFLAQREGWLTKLEDETTEIQSVSICWHSTWPE